MGRPRKKPVAATPQAPVPGPDDPRQCPHCGSNRLTHVRIDLTDGSSSTMISCTACDRRSWWSGSSWLDLQDVVNRVTKPGAAGIDVRETKVARNAPKVPE